ncbi:MAG TPA: glycosyltransferase family 39 protein [Anaerolineales bacterium]|nr:glycosyltransferase family 39 protein [Anaerolineales bacterium]
MSQTAELRTETPSLALSSRARLTRFLLPLGMLLAVLGEIVIRKTRGDSPSEAWMQAVAGVLLILGGFVFGAAAPAYASWSDPSENTNSLPRPWHIGLFWACFLAVAALILFDQDGETPLVLAAWLGSILMIVVAQLRGVRLHRPHIPRAEWLYLAGLALLLIVALVTRTYRLTALPYNLDGDFASVGLQARELAAGRQHQIFTYGWANIPMIGYLPAASAMLLFGAGLAGLNASGVVEGLLMLVGVYLLGRELFSARAGLFAAAVLTISYTHLAASRQAMYIDPAFFMLFAIYFLTIGLQRDQGWALALSGILTALCIDMYYAGRLIIPLLGLALLHNLLFRGAWLVARWRSLAMWAVTVLITLGPMLLVFAENPGAVGVHTEEVFILSPELMRHMEGVYRVTSPVGVLLQQLRHTLLMFHYYPDKGTQFGLTLPYLDPLAGILFALGFGYFLMNWRRMGSGWLLLWIVLGVFFGSFLTGNAPFWPRLIVLLPPVGLACGVAADLIYGYFRAALGPRGRDAVVSLALVALIIFLVAGISNWNAYVRVKGSYATARTLIARFMEKQPETARAYLVSNDFHYTDREFDFLVPGRLVGNLTPEQAASTLAPAGQPTFLILTAEQADLAAQLQQRYPGGPAEGNSPNEVAFYALRLP